jgi:hypothetical protein
MHTLTHLHLYTVYTLVVANSFLDIDDSRRCCQSVRYKSVAAGPWCHRYGMTTNSFLRSFLYDWRDGCHDTAISQGGWCRYHSDHGNLMFDRMNNVVRHGDYVSRSTRPDLYIKSCWRKMEVSRVTHILEKTFPPYNDTILTRHY